MIAIENAYVIGDVHGSFLPIHNFYQIMYDKDILASSEKNLMICLGDFGANFFFNHRDRNFKKKLGKYPFTYFVIRGNHEQRPSIIAKNNSDWEMQDYLDGPVWVEKEYNYIKYAMDYPEWYEYRLLDILTIPGAYSVDKYKRLASGWSWFPDEQLTKQEMEKCEHMVCYKNNWNLVLSHTCPKEVEPTDLFLDVVDQSMVDKTMEYWLNDISHQIDYNLWMFGHYHNTRYYSAMNFLMLFDNPVLDLNNYIKTKNVIESLIYTKYLSEEEKKKIVY